MKNLHLLIVFFLVLLVSAFSANLSILSADQNVLQQKCTKCHSLKLPENYSNKEWKYNVERMAKRAGLTEAEIISIINMNKKK